MYNLPLETATLCKPVAVGGFEEVVDVGGTEELLDELEGVGVTGLVSWRHWEYQSFWYLQIHPVAQVVPPLQPMPPHCCQGPCWAVASGIKASSEENARLNFMMRYRTKSKLSPTQCFLALNIISIVSCAWKRYFFATRPSGRRRRPCVRAIQGWKVVRCDRPAKTVCPWATSVQWAFGRTSDARIMVTSIAEVVGCGHDNDNIFVTKLIRLVSGTDMFKKPHLSMMNI